MKKRALSIIAVLALLIAALTVTAMAAETPVAPNNVNQYVVENMKGQFDNIDSRKAYCPVCNKETTWYGLSKGFSAYQTISYATNHFFLTNDIAHSSGGYFGVPEDGVSCLYLNGHNLTNEAYITLQAKGTMNLLGNGTETISGGGLNSPVYGAAIDVRGGTVNLFGVNVTKTPGTTRSGPTIGMNEAAGTLNVYNGTTISGGTNSGNGGNIGMYYEGCTVNIYGGTVSNGTATHGGNIYASGANYTVNISGGTVTGGEATTGNGGNISVCGKSAVNITSGTLSGGIAGNEGGNLYSDSYTQIKVSGGTVTGGKANNGGSFSVSNSYFTFTGGSISGGEATNMGGNLYFAVYATQYAGITINNKDGGDAPSLSNGIANGAGEGGGNIRVTVASGKTLTIEDLTATGGKGVYGGNITITGDGNVVLNNLTITNGKATYAPNIYTSAKGSVQMTNVSAIGGTGKDGGNASTGGSIYISNTTGATLTNCTFGNATTGTTATSGGTMYIGAPTTLNGCTVTKGTATGKGGNIYAGAALTINGSEISNGTAAGGGNIQMVSGAALTINKYGETKTTISGGYGGASQGGNISCSGDTVIKNATISGGMTTTAWGGNVYIDSAKITIGEGATIQNGSSSAGANLTAYAATVDIDDATFIGGTTNNTGTYQGGASLYLWNCDVTIDNSSITGGDSGAAVGGNVVLKSSKSLAVTNTTFADGNGARGGNLYLNSNPDATFTGCTISGGNATSYGGNMFLDGTTGLTFTECEILNGTCGVGGNFYVKSPVLFDDCVLTVASSATGSGSQFYNEGTVTLKNSTMTNGTVMGDGNVTLNNTIVNMANLDARTNSIVTLSGNTQVNKMTVSNTNSGIYVKKDFTGTVNLASIVGAPDAPIYGKELGANFTAEGNFSGKVIPTFTLEEPWVCNSNGKLVFAACRTVKNGEITWYADGAQAQAAYDGTGYLWPAIDGTIPVNGNCTIDLAGTNQTITGTGTVTIFDSANADFKTYGTATVNGPAVANAFATEVEGNTYYMIANGNTYTFHRLENKITGVSLRPSVAGMYYTSVWACDDALAQLIQSFGVAVNLKAQPAADFQTTSLYTAFQPSEFESGVNKNSVLVANIFSTEAEDNAVRGKQSIYASSYVTFANGETAYHAVETGKDLSLHDVLSILEANSNDYAAYAATLENFMTKWSQYGVTGDDWNFDFAVAPEIVTLNSLYAGQNAYQGELHDHANTGGNSDGKQTLQTWVDGMNKLKMDFATIVDHNQTRHMYLPEWQQATFIGGTEVSAWFKDYDNSWPKIDMNLTFATAEQFEAFVDEYADLFHPEIDPETGGYIFKAPGDMPSTDPAYNVENFVYVHKEKQYVMDLVQAVLKHGGFFTHVHPKSPAYLQSDNPLDYWFGDFTGLEVQYTGADDRNGTRAQDNYKLWLDLLAMGKKIYATAGNDRHNMPSVYALTTINASENTAVSLVEQMREGNFNPGPVGIRMAIGDTKMGGITDFTGKKLAFVIGNIHESELADGEHNYRVDLYKGSELVQSWDMPATGENFYQVVDIDTDADFYRLEVIDIEGDTIDRVALSQPIWNEK